MRPVTNPYTISPDEQRITSGGLTLTAKPVEADDDCCRCYFLHKTCPFFVKTGGAACTTEERKDSKTIVWQVKS